MKFLVDENESANVCGPLAQLHPAHSFDHAVGVGLQGREDLDLFAAMAARGYAALITQDRAQITQNQDELETLLELGIHWIGRKQSKEGGARRLAIASATLIGAMPDVIEQITAASAPLHLFLPNVQVGMGHRVKASTIESHREHLLRVAAARERHV